MDSIFSAKPHGPIPSAASPIFHIHSISRREFLGCGIQLRHPGLRYRAVRGKLGFQILRPRCFAFQDFVLQISIFVIAATVAAVTTIETIQLKRNRGAGGDKEIESELTSLIKMKVGNRRSRHRRVMHTPKHSNSKTSQLKVLAMMFDEAGHS